MVAFLQPTEGSRHSSGERWARLISDAAPPIACFIKYENQLENPTRIQTLLKNQLQNLLV